MLMIAINVSQRLAGAVVVLLTSKRHGKTPEEERLRRMRYHGSPYFWIECIPGDRYKSKDNEQNDIKAKEDVR
jgi:hypothetical protein